MNTKSSPEPSSIAATNDAGEHESHGHGHEHEHDHGLRGFLRELYRPHSHDVSGSVDSALESSAKGIRTVKISLTALLATALLQVLLVLVTGSTALLADTIHNFSDALTSIPLWVAFVVGRRAANRRYTYGYHRAEDLAGLFIVAMIALSALLVGWESIQRLIDPRPIENLGLVAAAGIIGFLGNELVAIYRIRVGREIGSAALVADGLHARTDGITSLAVLVAAVGVALGFPLVDPLVGLAITVMILYILRGAARSVFMRLMDAVDPNLVDQVEGAAGRTDGVVLVESVRIRWMGHRLEASLNVVVECGLTVAEGHAIAENVRHALFHEIRGLDYIVVHVDPCQRGDDDQHAMTRDHEGATARAPGS